MLLGLAGPKGRHTHVTEEQKQADTAETFAAALGAMDGATQKADKWEVRAVEQHASVLTTNDAITRERERAIVSMDDSEARDQRNETRDTLRHEVWLAEIKHVQAYRAREVAAFERIADALEKLIK
jgi:hypothetical protein